MLGNLIKKVFGDKAQRDLKEVQPMVERVKAEFAKLAEVSNDELRAKTVDFKQRIADRIKDEQARVDVLRTEIEEDPRMEIHMREERYKEIDELEEKIVGLIEDVLKEVLPEAFAVVKETARRFKGLGQEDSGCGIRQT